MKSGKPKIEVDQESGVVSISLKRGRGVESEISGNAVLDYDKNGDLVKVNLYSINFDNFESHKKDLVHFGRVANMEVAFH